MNYSLIEFFLALIVLIIGLSVIIWSIYITLFLPTQWFNPIGKTILITGCDSGIGLEIAKHLHRKGSNIIATVLSNESEGAKQLREKCRSDRMFLIEMNLTELKKSNDSIDRIGEILTANKFDLYALINNAGVCAFGEFDFLTFDQIEHQINVNFAGSIYLIKHMLPFLIKAKGRIINVSSVNALVPFPGIGVYSATKKALECFSESLAMELSRFDVQVLSLRLGDYVKLTKIMSKHDEIIREQSKNMDHGRKKLYENYFERYHQSVMKNKGMFSPKSFEQSSLFDDFDEVCYAVKPRNNLISATFNYKLIIYALHWLPSTIRSYVLINFSNKIQNQTSSTFEN
ncbi:Estradiol 17-beta-dehydrogenase 2 [Sarcoptes scabiei]|uniref:Estradiol 17-beta-dehydrogenase 2 n=1 Tax=Sarcoptes scabiei TaxID=52283 RepID=A0A834R1G6_SARSC|nr:Estradiol 17-beta-dehydrogenase 2 [Sarcoptes scabiei]